MSTPSVWDDPEIKVVSDYVKFNEPGDHVAGVITAVQIHRWDDGTACPKVLLIDDATGEETSFTAGQYRLKAALSEQRPAEGDHIAVTYKGDIKLKGGKSAKDFEVVTTRKGATPPASVPAAPAAPAAADPLAGLTPEQIAAVAALQAQQAK
jgi:hypothetical protein